VVDQFDERLKNWILSVVQTTEVSLAAPNVDKPGSGVGMYLLEVMQSPTPTTLRRSPLQLSLRYLITTWSERAEDAHQALVRLIFAAMENTEFQVELDPIPITVWTAFGVPPRPHFILRQPLRQERPEPQSKLVRQPLTVKTSPVIGLHGQLLGPGDLPLADCRVEIPALRLSSSTDYNGRFYFPAVPAEGTKRLLIKAKGRELAVSREENYPDSSAPMIVHFSPLEE